MGRRIISLRTKAALQEAKKRGTILGSHGKVLGEKNRQAANLFAQNIKDMLIELRSCGLSFADIANEFNKNNIASFKGGKWYGQTVKNAYERVIQLA